MAGQLLGVGTTLQSLHMTPLPLLFLGSTSAPPNPTLLQDKAHLPAPRGFSLPGNFPSISKCTSEVTSSRKPSQTTLLPA